MTRARKTKKARPVDDKAITPEEQAVADQLAVMSSELAAMVENLDKQLIAQGHDPDTICQPPPLPTRRDDEVQISMPDAQSAILFRAVCDKYGFEHHRYERQKSTTVMVVGDRDTIRDVLYPEFEALHDELFEVTKAKLDSLLERLRLTSTRS